MELVFQSGYEDCVGTPSDAHTNITGADGSLAGRNDWTRDLEGHPDVNGAWIYYEGGDASQRYARIIGQPDKPANKVLHFWLGDAYIPYGINALKGRIQASIDCAGLSEVEIQNRLYLPQDMAVLVDTPMTFGWLTIQEFWNDEVAKPYPFRISVNIVKPSSAPGLYLEAKGQTKITGEERWQDVWVALASAWKVPVGQWFTLKTYFKEGNATSGRFTLTVTHGANRSRKVVDVTGFTHHPENPAPDGLTKFNPMKLYAPGRLITPMRDSGRALQLYWDDFRLSFSRAV